jgi:hypothetical protein
MTNGQAHLQADVIRLRASEVAPAEDARDAFIPALDAAGISIMLN